MYDIARAAQLAPRDRMFSISVYESARGTDQYGGRQRFTRTICVMSRRFLFRLFAAMTPAGDHVSDRELLRRFVAAQDSAAFELIVRRHADAVWAAGLRIVKNEADAEDIFQAAFLALVRKAGSVRHACVGGWLHRVAVNAALKRKAGRTPIGMTLTSHVAADALDPTEQAETSSIVHQELARLPDCYRLPVVLCDLEGQTHAEAAKVLGWPIGSVSGRLSRAHAILRDRLTRRGLAAPAAFVAATTAPTHAVHAASALAAGTAVASPAVTSLTEGALSAMRIAKLKLTAAIVAAMGLVAVAGMGTGYALSGNGPPVKQAIETAIPSNVIAVDEPKPEDWTPQKLTDPVPTLFPELKIPVPPQANVWEFVIKKCPRIFGEKTTSVEVRDDPLRRVQIARLHQAQLEMKYLKDAILIGNWDSRFLDEMKLKVSEMSSLAQELWKSDALQLVPWLEECVVFAKLCELRAEMGVDTGNETLNVLGAARRYRLAAEADLWKAKNRK